MNLLSRLPPERAEDLLPKIRNLIESSGRCVVVLDDDPTGTQTVYDTPVLTTWSVNGLSDQLRRPDPMFYVLTNSRALVESDAVALADEIGRNLVAASEKVGRPVSVISRSDSTLRGHYPAEVDAIADPLGASSAVRVIMPYFLQGGRLTIGDVHYVAEGDNLVPAAETAFAKDATFGFENSNLIDWVIEKHSTYSNVGNAENEIRRESIHRVGIEELRGGDLRELGKRLASLPERSVVVVNSVSISDARAFAYAVRLAESSGATFVYRTAASFVQAYAALEERPLLEASQMVAAEHRAGLIVVGSYVPKTTAQLSHLLATDRCPAAVILDVDELLGDQRKSQLQSAIASVQNHLHAGRDVVLHTSRGLVTGDDAESSLRIGTSVSEALVEVVRSIDQPLRFLIAKGGITSSDVATKGLDVTHANVLGQILPGIPVWRLGDDCLRPGLPYVVFPGNVGGEDALAEAYGKLRVDVTG